LSTVETIERAYPIVFCTQKALKEVIRLRAYRDLPVSCISFVASHTLAYVMLRCTARPHSVGTWRPVMMGYLQDRTYTGKCGIGKSTFKEWL
jgi:cell shape-determining protein MreD